MADSAISSLCRLINRRPSRITSRTTNLAACLMPCLTRLGFSVYFCLPFVKDFSFQGRAYPHISANGWVLRFFRRVATVIKRFSGNRPNYVTAVRSLALLYRNMIRYWRNNLNQRRILSRVRYIGLRLSGRSSSHYGQRCLPLHRDETHRIYQPFRTFFPAFLFWSSCISYSASFFLLLDLLRLFWRGV